ncbi:DUF3817 domain-containing protein [Roseibium suaedae]|uniref:Integral membrane protein n=1 Tax=Roseibium suaedae TaxID=735517 RepID=A0A1M7IJ43_9HYPH|nr:DUF3817 domain-containing protein [Roseibium suaedae]SHM40689.1 integral membrane protein [Roseibium suaedae]
MTGQELAQEAREPNGERSPIKWLVAASLFEAVTLALLVCVAVPLKHAAGFEIATKIMGPVHGLAFLIYLWTVFNTVSDGSWKASAIARLVLSAFVPFAGFLTPRFIRHQRGALGRR